MHIYKLLLRLSIFGVTEPQVQWALGPQGPGRMAPGRLGPESIGPQVSFFYRVFLQNNLLIKIRNKYSNDKIIFANGGDRSDSSKILEFETAKQYNIDLKFGIGGSHKESSSSDLLKRWSEYSKKI